MTDSAVLDTLEAGVLAGDRMLLAKAITMVESGRANDRMMSRELLVRLASKAHTAQRIGISGVPGVGKSTLIEALGMLLIERGMTVAVLAVDPSSTLSGGSILGDKSRMGALAQAQGAFVRPSPSAATLGGVALRTREAAQLCEAAGFDVILVETVGVGQSETAVANMVDLFLVLTLPGAGDELQGIKKGILEHADIIAVNKADGDRVELARSSVADHAAALHYTRPEGGPWRPRALAVSAKTGSGLEELWDLIQEHHQALQAAGLLDERRQLQRSSWMWAAIEERLVESFRSQPGMVQRLQAAEARVRSGEQSPEEAADDLTQNRPDPHSPPN